MNTYAKLVTGLGALILTQAVVISCLALDPIVTKYPPVALSVIVVWAVAFAVAIKAVNPVLDWLER